MRNNMFFLLCRPVVPRNKILNRHLQSLHSSHCVAKFTRSDARSRSRCKQLSASLSQRRVKRQWAESSLIIKNATRISQLRYLRFNPRLGFHFHSRDDANDTQTPLWRGDRGLWIWGRNTLCRSNNGKDILNDGLHTSKRLQITAFVYSKKSLPMYTRNLRRE